ncbi:MULTISPECIES: Cys-tRNA(Pro) deacylase [Psychrilyobacter]|uniref:Cys-tRNA(Pro)/Cys-tRNA(Cys) deacylase n=1 Tax=Psychrilyobacter piezotolerans TaxID=2293438 RepID=A0ABX9KE13_9FUSO|nr:MULTISPECIES: Cys-tRNA(Pro) deacylase [Psychrilyobacter]MCS5421702.1 Cys-tRNA(Pro) deacylase [Psychrilyobacter sp. S5]NDI78867.1 Cys-tRNA(Pro) deacylase [Psychrilyobacter piezotolerans]RDE59374.1 Cys-tRNA(Pro) deacylase [Psychrilyobacter sp. S5]REI39877.1 Cys-tRNA(Pro) deacylase [Psychrilyobacter piezotolerans]
MKKTNAMRILDKNKIPYGTDEYEYDESDLSAVAMAEKTKVDIDRIFKTLVLLGDKTGYLVACIPGKQELDLKKLAKISKNKKVEMIHMKDLLKITGYMRGGCSPLGMKKLFPTYMENSCLNFETIFISGGKRGMQIEIAPNNLIKILDIRVDDISINI